MPTYNPTINGPFDLGTLPGGAFAVCNGVNGNGSVVVGGSDNGSGLLQAFVWTLAGGMVQLPNLPGDITSQAFATNADGSLICGASGAPGSTAVLWITTITGTTVRRIGATGASIAYAISSDGAAVVGGDGADVSLWDALGGQTLLGTPPAITGGASGFGVNADGSVITGGSGASGNNAWIWQAAGGGVFTSLGLPTGSNTSNGNDISDDGTVIIGYTGFADNQAWQWGALTGFLPPENNGNFPSGTGDGAFGISGDGMTMVGTSGMDVGLQNTAWFITRLFGGFLEFGLPQLQSGGLGSNTRAVRVSKNGFIIVGWSELAGVKHAVIWAFDPGVSYVQPVNLPAPLWAYPLVALKPLDICIGSHSHAAGMFYGLRAMLPRTFRR